MPPFAITAAHVACAILLGDHNLPRSRAEEIAAIEAEAFVGSIDRRPHVNLLTVLAVAYVESRFNPTGSQLDRDHGMWGVMQIAAPRLRCLHRGHDDPARCTDAQREERDRLLDVERNIAIGAQMLEAAWLHAHARTPRDWVGVYYVGHVPAHRRGRRSYHRYAERVRHASRLFAANIERCEREEMQR